MTKPAKRPVGGGRSGFDFVRRLRLRRRAARRLCRSAVWRIAGQAAQPLVLFERHRHHGSLAGASRDDQRHDYVVQHFQCRIGAGYRHYGRRRRGSRGDGLWAVRSHSGSGSSRLFYAAPGPHHYGHGTVFFCS